MMTRRRHSVTPPSIEDGVVSINRRAAFGDVIGATVLADELHRLGYKVQFNTLPQIQSILYHHRSITRLAPPDQPGHIMLDGAYEKHSQRKEILVMSIFWKIAQEHLARHGVEIRSECNLRPQLNILPFELARARSDLLPWPRPWVVVVPQSNGWANRTIPQHVWKAVGAKANATLLWSGTDRISDGRIVDLHCKDIRKMTAIMATADMVVGVDTGPMWCAAGVNAPILGVTQTRRFGITFNDQVDWQEVAPDLECIGCSEFICPINADKPPCQKIDPEKITFAIEARLDTVRGNKISAVIPCLHDKEPRILRCLESVINQVDEVVFSMDGSAGGSMIPGHPKVRVVHSPGGKRTGFGKTCNRGARQSTGRYILFLNDDLYLDPQAVRHMKRAVAEPDVAVVGGLWRYPDGTIQHGGGGRWRPTDVGFGHLDHRATTNSLKTLTELEFVTAACFLVRREAFFKAGAFGEEFGNYCEDADLCMKLRQQGWKVMFQPVATGIHDESQTTKPEKMTMLKEAGQVFKDKWERYFTHNPPGQLGVFT